jgi:hypothetical protein
MILLGSHSFMLRLLGIIILGSLIELLFDHLSQRGTKCGSLVPTLLRLGINGME